VAPIKKSRKGREPLNIPQDVLDNMVCDDKRDTDGLTDREMLRLKPKQLRTDKQRAVRSNLIKRMWDIRCRSNANEKYGADAVTKLKSAQRKNQRDKKKG
jgi:hypothetical protein